MGPLHEGKKPIPSCVCTQTGCRSKPTSMHMGEGSPSPPPRGLPRIRDPQRGRLGLLPPVKHQSSPNFVSQKTEIRMHCSRMTQPADRNPKGVQEFACMGDKGEREEPISQCSPVQTLRPTPQRSHLKHKTEGCHCDPTEVKYYRS